MSALPAPERKVVVHPLVLLSVVDHYNRVAKDTKFRVVGCLLGDASKDQVQKTEQNMCIMIIAMITVAIVIVGTTALATW